MSALSVAVPCEPRSNGSVLQVLLTQRALEKKRLQVANLLLLRELEAQSRTDP